MGVFEGEAAVLSSVAAQLGGGKEFFGEPGDDVGERGVGVLAVGKARAVWCVVCGVWWWKYFFSFLE